MLRELCLPLSQLLCSVRLWHDVHSSPTWREVPVTVLHSERLVTLAGLPLPESVTVRAADDAAPHTGVFAVMPGLDSLKQAVANGLGIGIVPRAAVSSLALAGLVAIRDIPGRVADEGPGPSRRGLQPGPGGSSSSTTRRSSRARSRPGPGSGANGDVGLADLNSCRTR